MFHWFVAGVIVWALWWLKQDQARYSNSPPGPFRLPFIGNILQIVGAAKYPPTAFKKLAEMYGPVMFLKIGPGEAVVVSSPDSIKEILSHEKCQDRLQFNFVQDRLRRQNVGLAWHNGPTWHVMTRFIQRNLREFGFGKSSTMDAVLNREFSKISEFILSKCDASKGNVVYVENLFNIPVTNVLWYFMSGQQFDYDDPVIVNLLRLNKEFFKSTNVGFDIGETYPILRDLFPGRMGRTKQIETSEQLYKYGKGLLDKHRLEGGYRSEVNSFLDAFRVQIEKESGTIFTDEQFIFVILDLFLGGSETSSLTLTFSVLYMLLWPEAQEKVQQELDKVLGKDLSLDSSMKSKLPYTCATILEIYRYSSVAAVPPARQATGDFTFRGWQVKKGTAVMFNAYAVHYSEELWGDPHNFRPERFLNKQGTQVDPKVADQLQVFGSGKRSCPGRALGETSIFILFSLTMRRFKFVKVPGTNPTAEQVLGVTMTPKPFYVQILDRNENK